MSKRNGLAVVAAALLATAALPGLASAADMPPPPPAAGPSMTGSLSIYGWLPWYNGKAGVNGLGPAKFSGTPIDILNNLKFTFMANGEVRWNKIGVYGDLIYLNIADKNATPGPLYGSAKLDMKTLILTAALTYQVYEDEAGWIQGVAGARVWSIDTALNLTAGINPAASASDTISWVDPVVGVRLRHALSQKMFLTGTGLIGGFGAGSDFMWDVFGGVGYNFTPAFSTTAGFRAMGVNYSNSGDVVKLTTYGPLISFNLAF